LSEICLPVTAENRAGAIIKVFYYQLMWKKMRKLELLLFLALHSVVTQNAVFASFSSFSGCAAAQRGPWPPHS